MRTAFLISAGLLLCQIVTCSAKTDSVIEGVWQGVYSCHGRPTSLILEIKDADQNRVTARATFNPPSMNATGEFELIGTFDPAIGGLDLKYTRWIKQLPGYVMAGYRGTLEFRTNGI